MKFKRYTNWLCILVVGLVVSSCGVSKKVMREQQFLETNLDSLAGVQRMPILLQEGDFVRVAIYSESYNQEQITPFLLGGVSADKAAALHQLDFEGNIHMPFIGKIKANHLTTFQLADTIKQKLTSYIKNPGVFVGYEGLSIKVLGQVLRQGVYPFKQDQVTIFDALTAAGGISEFGRKDSILVLRQIGNKQEVKAINLTSGKAFANDVYKLQQNDIVIVKDNGLKYALDKRALKDRQINNIMLYTNFLIIVLSAIVLIRRF